jgi:hypothetical protein
LNKYSSPDISVLLCSPHPVMAGRDGNGRQGSRVFDELRADGSRPGIAFRRPNNPGNCLDLSYQHAQSNSAVLSAFLRASSDRSQMKSAC